MKHFIPALKRKKYRAAKSEHFTPKTNQVPTQRGRGRGYSGLEKRSQKTISEAHCPARAWSASITTATKRKKIPLPKRVEQGVHVIFGKGFGLEIRIERSPICNRGNDPHLCHLSDHGSQVL